MKEIELIRQVLLFYLILKRFINDRTNLKLLKHNYNKIYVFSRQF